MLALIRMRHGLLAPVCLVLTLLSSYASAATLTEADLDSWLAGMVPATLQMFDIAGAQVVVVKDGNILFKKGYGYADVQARRPVDVDQTLFRPGSTSKLLTWTAVMQLVEQGRLDLDADVNRYLDFKIPPLHGQPVTLRNLMTHTAGFEERNKGLFATDIRLGLSLQTFVKRWVPERIFAPGTTSAYSNYGAALAGYIVARISGESFEDYIEHHILEPLDMRQSSFAQPLPERLRTHLASGYNLASEPAKAIEMIPGAPAGSLAATGSDMAHFMIAHLEGGSYAGHSILRPQTVQMMHATVWRSVPPLNGIALGFYESNYNGHRIIGHGGDTIWFHTTLRLFLDDHVGLYLSLNSAGRDGWAPVVIESFFRQFCDRYFPGPTVDGAVAAAVAREHAAQLAGATYESTRRSQSNFASIENLFSTLTVTANDDGTISHGHGFGGQTPRWREVAPYLWREVGGKRLLAATVEDGHIKRFATDLVAPIFDFEPQPLWRSSAWLLPAWLLSLAILLITALCWPVGALTRWGYGMTPRFAGFELAAQRMYRAAASASVLMVVGWASVLLSIASLNIDTRSPILDVGFFTLECLSALVFPSALALHLWYVVFVFANKRRWVTKLSSLALALSSLVVLWVALVYKLISFGVEY